MIVTYHGAVVLDVSRQTFDVAYCVAATAWIVLSGFVIVRAMR